MIKSLEKRHLLFLQTYCNNTTWLWFSPSVVLLSLYFFNLIYTSLTAQSVIPLHTKTGLFNPKHILVPSINISSSINYLCKSDPLHLKHV